MTDFRYERPERLSSLSIVLPAYNEAEIIKNVVLEAIKVAKKLADEYEVIIVNDGSKDNTVSEVEQLVEQDPQHIRLINNRKNIGYGPTIRKGLKEAKKDWVFFTDSDGQFDLTEIAKLVPYSDDYDFIVGRRKKRKDPLNRKINAGIFNIAVRIFFGIRVKDVDCAFKLMRREKLSSLKLVSNSAMINTEILHKAQKKYYQIKEVSITHLPRKQGYSTGANKDVVFRAVREFFSMRYSFLKDRSALIKLNTRIVFWLSIIAGIAITSWSYKHHVILAFGDAEAHLNIAKRVVSGLTPGIAQLGGVWLPLPHLLMAPFTISNFLWRSGLAGSIVSVAAFAWLCIMAYLLAYELTSKFIASYIAPLALILNPNLLYLASTPMTETLLLSMVTSTVYYFVKWMKSNDIRYFMAMSLFGLAATLSRYDGWPVVCLELLFIGIIVFSRSKSWRKTEGMLLTFGYIGFAGIIGWLLWNKIIFGTFMYFANSVYGSKEQQLFFLHKGYLPTDHHLWLSIYYFADDIRLIVGLPLLLIACFGFLLFIYDCLRKRRYAWMAVAFLTLSAIPFYVGSLYTGQASLLLPDLAKAGAQYTISNVRYGVQILLAVALFLSYLASRRRILVPILIVAIALQAYVLVATNNVITYIDATKGLSSQAVSKGPYTPAAEAYMRTHYNGGLVLMDDYRNPIGLVESGVPMNDFIGSGNKPYWQDSLDNPAKYDSWVVLQKATTDAVWTGIKNKQILTDHFSVVFQSGDIYIYHKKTTNKAFVQESGQHLTLDGKPFIFKGVNSYDLMTDKRGTIAQTMKDVENSGFNTIRLWCFNKQGTITTLNYLSLDYIVEQAHEDNLKLICTLGDTLSDYGGVSIFGASNTNQFFTNPQIIKRYESYIDSVVSHRNSITGVRYSQDSAIAAWELINEPRVEGDQNSQTLAGWVEEVGESLLSVDPNHLLSPGTEGFVSTTPESGYQNTTEGANIQTICSLDVVSLCSAHLYPKYLNGTTATDVDNIIGQWRTIADQLNKPIFLGEVGYDMSATGDNQTQRLQFIMNVSSAVKRYQLDGGLLWNLGQQADSSYTIHYGDSNSQQVLNAWAAGL